MRNVLCVGGIFLLATVLFAPNAQAQISYSGDGACNKGIFWPFSRSPGDCLTDTERESGMSGTYRGSEVQEPESGAEATAPAQAQQSAPASQAAVPSVAPSAPSASPTVASPAAPTPVPTAPATGTAAVQPASAQGTRAVGESVSEEGPASDDRTTYTGPGGCTKGIFWPFSRSPGDCLTDTEISSGQSGTYQ